MTPGGPEHFGEREENTTEKAQDFLDQSLIDNADTFGYGREAEEWVSSMDVWRSRGAESEKIRHVEEFRGDSDSLDYAIDLAEGNASILIDQLRAMTSPDMDAITPEQLDRIERQLERGTAIGGQDMLADIGESRDIYRQTSFELRTQNFEDRFHQEAWDRIDKGQSFGYEDLVKLAGVSEAGQMGLYEEMDDTSRTRFAITFPARDFLSPEDLQSAMDYYADSLPSGMRGMADHPYTWSLLENPMKNPNLTEDQLDAVVGQIYDIACNPERMEAYYNASRVLQFVEGHPNCSDHTKGEIQRYMDWMKENDGDDNT